MLKEGGLLRLKDAQLDIIVAVMFLVHTDVVACQPRQKIWKEDVWRQGMEEREAQQVAEAVNAGKVITVMELWKHTSVCCHYLQTSNSGE